MTKYSVPVVVTVIGISFFLLGIVIGEFSIREFKFPVDDLFVSISANLISIAVLVFVYEILGGERTINLIQHLIKLQKISHNIAELGIEEIVDMRRKFDYDQVHRNLKRTKEMFIASRTFDSICYNDVKKLFHEHLEKPNTTIKILIDSKSRNCANLRHFREQLPKDKQNRLEIKLSDTITSCIYGSDNTIYYVPYLNTLRGDESPSILCSHNSNNKHSLYSIYFREFYETWNK
ncbi:MAG: hypothetical protein AB4057_15205 [Crocosphaera sp.]